MLKIEVFNTHSHIHNSTATKYRIGFSVAQLKILSGLIQAEKNRAIHPTDYDVELSLIYLGLTRMIKNVEGDLKKPDSSYVSDSARKRAAPLGDISIASLGLTDEAKLLGMTPEAEAEHWKKLEEQFQKDTGEQI